MEHYSGDFSVAVRDIRQYSQQDSEALTLLWVLEGRVGLRDGDLRQPLHAVDLAIVNRHQRWSLSASARTSACS